MPQNKYNELVHVINARRGTYSNVIKQIREDGVCPFCPQYLSAYHKKPILKRGKYWLVTKNMYPYENTRVHFLLIHKKHIDSLIKISRGAWNELREQYLWLLKKYKIPGGTALLRFGDSRYTGSSVTHLHAQLAVTKLGKMTVTRI